MKNSTQTRGSELEEEVPMNTSDIIEGERVPLRTKGRPLRVLIADDHALFRDGLRRLLEDQRLFGVYHR